MRFCQIVGLSFCSYRNNGGISAHTSLPEVQLIDDGEEVPISQTVFLVRTIFHLRHCFLRFLFKIVILKAPFAWLPIVELRLVSLIRCWGMIHEEVLRKCWKPHGKCLPQTNQHLGKGLVLVVGASDDCSTKH